MPPPLDGASFMYENEDNPRYSISGIEYEKRFARPFTMLSTIYEAAQALDVIKPDWYQKVNTKRLEMFSPDNCILGQSFNDYPRDEKSKHESGFVVGMHLLSGLDYRWACGMFSSFQFRAAWIEEIEVRRNPRENLWQRLRFWK